MTEELGDFESQLAKLDAEREEEDQTEELHVGDHVSHPNRDANMLVVERIFSKTAAEYEITVDGETKTLVDFHGDEHAGDDVVEVIFPKRTDVELSSQQRYAYPVGTLEVEGRLHDVDEDGGEA